MQIFKGCSGIEFLAFVRIALICVFLTQVRGTPFFWLGFYFLLKEFKFWIKWRR